MYRVFVVVTAVLSVIVASLNTESINPKDSNTDIFAELRPQLSQNATIILPGDLQMQAASVRWSSYSRPTYRAVVQVAVEDDVVKTVRIEIALSYLGLETTADALCQGSFRKQALHPLPRGRRGSRHDLLAR